MIVLKLALLVFALLAAVLGGMCAEEALHREGRSPRTSDPATAWPIAFAAAAIAALAVLFL